jgi:predicted esterase
VRRCLALWVLLALALPASAGAAEWHQWRGQGTGVFRTAAYDRGEWIATNGIWQARGANTDGLHRDEYFKALAIPGDPTNDSRDVSLALTYGFFGAYRASHNGDFELPRDPAQWPDGTADLAEVRLAVQDGMLFVRLLWNSMPRPDAQVATIAFGGAGAGERPWPRGAGLSSPWAAALTVWGKGAALTSADGKERVVDARAGDHVTEARVPLSALPPGAWSITAGSGLSDPAEPGRYWTVPAGDATATRPGSGGPSAPTNVWDLLLSQDKPWSFDERHQADVLVSGSAATEAATVDPALLAAGASRRPAAVTGDLSRMFTSRLAGPDGIEKSAGLVRPPTPEGVQPPSRETGFDQAWNHTGRLQWYGMHVPERYATSGKEKWPLIVYLHGYGAAPDEAFYLPVGFIAEADRRGYLVATPLGRGDRFYREDGDLDVQEVLRDVHRHYRVDRDRIYLMGHSMGGYGTNNVATHHPDQFAAVAPVEGTDAIDLHGNLRHVPWFAIGAVEDLDANAEQARAMYAALSKAGHDAALLVYDLKIHEYSSIYDTLPRLFDFFAAHRRPRNPAIVSWTRPAGHDRPDLGLVYDGAYWLRGVRAADDKQLATVTAESLGIAHRRSDPEKAKRAEEAREDPGPSGRTRGTLYTTTPDPGTPVAVANVLRVTADNAAAATVDLRRARLRVTRRRPLLIRSSSKTPLTLTLRHTRLGAARVRLDRGRRGKGSLRRRVRAGKGVLVVQVPAGTHTVGLRRVR